MYTGFVRMINTVNETHLHKTLKTLYALQHEGSATEVEIPPYIADIATADGDIIEIQTGSLSRLKEKAAHFVRQGRYVTVVYPLVVEKVIETRTTAGKITRRKSPKKQHLYSMFRELTGLCSVLLDKNISLEVLEVAVTEERFATEEPVQSKNGRRRFCKRWLKKGKRLESIKERHVFHGKRSWNLLLPHKVAEPFTKNDVYLALKSDGISASANEVSLMLWVFAHMQLVIQDGKRGRENLYRRNTKALPD